MDPYNHPRRLSLKEDSPPMQSKIRRRLSIDGRNTLSAAARREDGEDDIDLVHDEG
jgi:hypothetical protein